MPGASHGLKANYSIATQEGFARLSRMAGRDYEQLPSDSGNVNEDIMLDAVYGGAADPSEPREYAVYSLDWLDADPEEIDELEELDEAERVAGQPVEDFTQYLDENFEGWVYDQERDTVYVLEQQSDDARGRQQTRRRR